MTLRWRRWAVVLACTLLLAGCTSGRSSPHATPGPTSRHPSTTSLVTTTPPEPTDPTAPCAADNLRASLVGGGPAMGHVSLVIRLVNRGRFPCREHGWPRVIARSGAGQAVARHTHSDPALTGGTIHHPPVVELAPGRAAYLVATGSDVAFGASGAARSCPAAYHTFRITMPGDNRVLVVKPRFEPTLATFHGFPSCTGVAVTPVVPAAEVSARVRTAPGHRPLPRCHAGQLHVRYRAGAFATGHDFGYLRIVNDSAASCQASGPVVVRAIDKHGRPIRLSGTPDASVRLRAVQFLAHGATHRTAAIMVGASVRTADGRDACPIDQRVAPAAWRLTGAVTATVTNTDPTVQPYERGRVRHLYGCSGAHGIALVDATLTSR